MKHSTMFGAIAALALIAQASHARSADIDQAGLAGQIRAGLQDRLKDASSAQIVIERGPWHDQFDYLGHPQEGEFVCGKVNAKNSYGAYVGFRPALFIIRADGKVSMLQKGIDPILDAAIDQRCASPAT